MSSKKPIQRKDPNRPLWLEVHRVTAQYSIAGGTQPKTDASTPDDIAARAASAPRDVLIAWRRDGCAGLILRGDKIAWETARFPAVAIEVWTGKGGGYVAAVLRDGGSDCCILSANPHSAQTLAAMKRIFDEIRGLFPGGVEVLSEQIDC